MSEIVLGDIDRQLRGALKCTLNTDPPYVAFRHAERDGREGGRLVVKLDEVDAVVALLTKAKAVAAGSKPAQHRTVRIDARSRAQIEFELEEDRKLF
ncbi:MAG: hypothetical protein ABW061_20660 [Polyangiaceae bacterium]